MAVAGSPAVLNLKCGSHVAAAMVPGALNISKDMLFDKLLGAAVRCGKMGEGE